MALSLAAAACGGGQTTPEAGGAGESGGLVGKPAPEISAEHVTGEGPKNLGEAKGKVAIVDFWATYCDPCKKSFPKYQAMVEEFGGDLAVIAVSVDDPDDAKKEQLEAFASETGAKFAIVWDKDKSAAQKYSPPKMPTSFVVDKEGVVKHMHAGYESGEEEKISAEVKALLGK